MKEFKNPIAPKERKQEAKPYSFIAPDYDKRNDTRAGTEYGTGFNVPVGTMKTSKKNAIPSSRKHGKD